MKAHELSQYVYEHIIASHYGWELDNIRKMDLQDFHAHLRICMERDSVRNEFQAILAGATNPESEERVDAQPQVISSRKMPSGATVETTREKSMKFTSKVKSVRINKKGEYIGDV